MLANHPTVLGRAPTASSIQIGNVDGPNPALSTDNALVRWDGTSGRLIQNGVVTEADYTGTLTGPTDQATTTAVGLAFTNQPANDGVEVLSANAGDTTQTVTIIGTTNGTDTVVVETVALNGTTPVATVKTDWGVILAVKKSAVTLGTVTVREASGDATITAGLTAAVLSVGVTTVTNTAAYNRVLSMVASGATTKQLGFQGTNTSGTVIYDSQALTGTTAAASNVAFYTLTEIYRGDLEATRTATVTTGGGWSLTGGGGGTLSFDTLGTGNTISGNLTFGTAGSILSGTTGSQGITVTGIDQSFTITPSGTGSAILALQNGNLTFSNVGGSVVEMKVNTAGKNLRITNTASGTTSLRTSAGASILSVSDSGNTLLGGLTTDGTGVLQLPAHTTAAGGISLAPGMQIFTDGSGITHLRNPSGDTQLQIDSSTSGKGLIEANSGNFRITSTGFGNSLFLRTTTGGGTAADALTLDSSQNATFAAHINESTDTKSGAGAISVTATTTRYTSTGGAEALTLADGTNGQIKRIIHVVDAGSGVLTPTTKTGYTTITFTNAGDAATLQFVTTQGWCIVGIFGAVAA